MRYVLDSSVLIAAVNPADRHHLPCYSFIREHEDEGFVVPTIAYFEFQAAQSRVRREGRKSIRELYLPNAEVYELTRDTMKRASEGQLFDLLSPLKGADLVYACVAVLERAPLVTTDHDFSAVSGVVTIINLLGDRLGANVPPQNP